MSSPLPRDHSIDSTLQRPLIAAGSRAYHSKETSDGSRAKTETDASWASANASRTSRFRSSSGESCDSDPSTTTCGDTTRVRRDRSRRTSGSRTARRRRGRGRRTPQTSGSRRFPRRTSSRHRRRWHRGRFLRRIQPSRRRRQSQPHFFLRRLACHRSPFRPAVRRVRRPDRRATRRVPRPVRRSLPGGDGRGRPRLPLEGSENGVQKPVDEIGIVVRQKRLDVAKTDVHLPLGAFPSFDEPREGNRDAGQVLWIDAERVELCFLAHPGRRRRPSRRAGERGRSREYRRRLSTTRVANAYPTCARVGRVRPTLVINISIEIIIYNI